jgi:hypothetical protein
MKTISFNCLYLLIYDTYINEPGVLEQPKIEEVPMNLGDDFESTKIHSIMHRCI